MHPFSPVLLRADAGSTTHGTEASAPTGRSLGSAESTPLDSAVATGSAAERFDASADSHLLLERVGFIALGYLLLFVWLLVHVRDARRRRRPHAPQPATRITLDVKPVS